MDMLKIIQIFLKHFYFVLAKFLKSMSNCDFGMSIFLDKDLKCSFLCCWLHIGPCFKHQVNLALNR